MNLETKAVKVTNTVLWNVLETAWNETTMKLREIFLGFILILSKVSFVMNSNGSRSFDMVQLFMPVTLVQVFAWEVLTLNHVS